MNNVIALYMRLSDEDDNLGAQEESNSISHQRKLMLDYISAIPELKEFEILEFSDDGYSGADFNRPDFQKMMKLVKAGKIQVIITKDYSRLGRDYLEVGNYMEYIFPMLQIRYISVNDGYDSATMSGSTGGMGVALKNLVNALYCRDASKKVRAAKAVLAKQGKYIAAFAPFGYIKSDDDKHVLTPDPETAHIVKLIFELAIKGMKYTEIADYLNNNGYDSILTFLNKKGLKRSMYRDIGVREWNPTSVMEVLFNETYIGSVVYSKTEDNIDTGHAVVKRDKEDWIIVPDRHEPLVSVEDYKLAHKMIARREYQPRKPTGGWQPSLIRCSVCGKGLDKYIGKYYRCRNKHLSKIDIFGLHDAILESTRVMALTQLKEFEIKESGVQEHELIETEISNLKKKKDYYARLKFEMYDDYTKGNLSREVMAKKTKEIKEKIAIIEKDICDKSELLIARNDLYEDAEKEQLTKLSKLEEYNSNVIRCLVDHVKVYDNDHIEIIWNFDDFQVG